MASIFQTSKVKGGRGKVTRPPVFSVAPTSATIPSAGGSIQFTASDPDGGAVTYSLSARYSILITIDSSGLVSVPGSLQGTNGNITVVAMDPTGATTSATCAVSVTAVPVAPVFTVAPTSATIGSSGGTIQFTATASSTITYSLSQRYSTSITINSSTGLVSVPSSLAGTNGTITVRATANGLSTDTQPCAVTVQEASEYANVNISTFENTTVGQLTYQQDPTNWTDLAQSATSRQFIVSAPVRSGTRATRSFVSRDDVNNPTGERCEIRWFNPANLPTTWTTVSGKAVRESLIDWWWGFSIYVPATWKTLFKQTNGQPDLANIDAPIMCQMHRTADTLTNTAGVLGGPWSDTEPNPWFSLRLGGNTVGTPLWFIRADVNANPISLQGQETFRNFSAGTAQRGEWTDWVFQCRYSPLTGYLRAWRKDSTTAGAFTQVVNQTGGVGYFDVTASYLKIGMYHSLWDNNKYPTRVTVDVNNNVVRSAELFYDEFRWYAGNDGSISHVRPR